MSRVQVEIESGRVKCIDGVCPDVRTTSQESCRKRQTHSSNVPIELYG